MRLGIVYHMPFWRDADGGIREVEGSFARYVDAVASYVDEVVLCVPVRDTPAGEGTRLRAPNVRLAPLPYFDGPRQFYPQLPAVRRRLRSFVREIDLMNLRDALQNEIDSFTLLQFEANALAGADELEDEDLP